MAAEDVLAADEDPGERAGQEVAAPAAEGKDEADPEERRKKAAAGMPHVLIDPDPGRAADAPAGHGLAAESRPRCRAVTRLGPGGVQDWAGDVITILARTLPAVSWEIIHNRLRDWHDGNHPGDALGRPSRVLAFPDHLGRCGPAPRNR